MAYQSATLFKTYYFNLYVELYKNLSVNTIGDKLKKMRLMLGMTQQEFSQLLDIQRSAVNDYESNNILPAPDVIIKLSNILGKDSFKFDDYARFILSDYQDRLKKWRIDNKYSLRKVASIIEVCSTTYRSWENGTSYISRDSFYKNKSILSKIADT